MQNEVIYRFFTDDDFLRISNKIKEMEKITAGEIRIVIKEKKSFSNRKKDLKKLTEEEFFKLGMQETRDKTGILIYILLTERQFYILADSGINEKVEHNTWDEVKNEMQEEFIRGHFTDGIIHGIDRVGHILSDHFPIKPDDTNELSNKVVF